MVGLLRDTPALLRGAAVLHPDIMVRPSNTEPRRRATALLRRQHMVVRPSSMEVRLRGMAVRHPGRLLDMAVHRSSMALLHKGMVARHPDMGVAETRITAVATTSITINFVGSRPTFRRTCNDRGAA
jgi:hypothetical protein